MGSSSVARVEELRQPEMFHPKSATLIQLEGRTSIATSWPKVDLALFCHAINSRVVTKLSISAALTGSHTNRRTLVIPTGVQKYTLRLRLLLEA